MQYFGVLVGDVIGVGFDDQIIWLCDCYLFE